MSNSKLVASSLLMLVLATGCGGSGGDSAPPSTPPAPAAEGLYNGTTGDGRSTTGIVLDDGTYYFLYSFVGNPNLIAGVVQGDGTSTGATFTSNNAVDFNLQGLGVMPATVSATYHPKQSISGTVSYPTKGAFNTFGGTYNPLYEATPSLTALAGTFTGQAATSAGVETATVTIQSSGSLSGTGSSGCNFTGTATPRAHGNVFNVSISFGAAPCLFANQTLSGIAFFDANAKRLYTATPNETRTDGALFVGTKP